MKGDKVFRYNNLGYISKKVTAIILMVIGIGILLAGFVMAFQRILNDEHYNITTGEVIGVSYYGESSDDASYSAIYSYHVGDTEYELNDDDLSNVPPQMGKTVEIRYDPSQPAKAYVGGRHLPGSILMSIGILMIMLSILAFVKMRKGKKSDERKLVIELLTGVIMLVVCIGTIVLLQGTGERLGLSEISVIVCGVLGIIIIFSSVKYYIEVKMGRTPSESIISYAGI